MAWMAIKCAFENDKLEMIDELIYWRDIEKIIFFEANIAISMAAKYNNFSIMKDIYSKFTKFPWEKDSKIFSNAVTSGNLTMLKWLIANGCDYDESAYINAAKGGKIHILKFLKNENNHIPFDKIVCKKNSSYIEDHVSLENEICEAAVRREKINVLKWMIKENGSLGGNICDIAAEHGYFDILKFARRQGCGWSEDACMYAAAYDRLEILKWLRSGRDPCPWNEDMYIAACEENSTCVLEWLEQQIK